jgi:hypothetical protein
MVQNNSRFAKSNVKKERRNQVMKKERFFLLRNTIWQRLPTVTGYLDMTLFLLIIFSEKQ